MESDKKMLIALIVAFTSLGVIILSLICLWIYHRRSIQKSQEVTSHSSGTLFMHFIGFLIPNFWALKYLDQLSFLVRVRLSYKILSFGLILFYMLYFVGSTKEFVLAPFIGKHSSLKINRTKGSVSLMDYKLLETATNNFRESDILGVGGFGCVYKARLDENVYAAVKRLEGESPDSIREFDVKFAFQFIYAFNFVRVLCYELIGFFLICRLK